MAVLPVTVTPQLPYLRSIILMAMILLGSVSSYERSTVSTHRLQRTSLCLQPKGSPVVVLRGGVKLGGRKSNEIAAAAVSSSVKNQAKLLLSTSQWTGKEIGFLVLGVVAGLSSAAAMWLENGFLIDVVAWLCVVCGSSTVVLQRKLTDFETLRELNNETRERVNLLKAANTRLSKQNKKLASNAAKLKKAQAALSEISANQGVSVEALVKQVEQYKQVQDQMKQSIKTKIRQTLLSVVIKSDTDGDFEIDASEIDTLCSRLSMIPNVKFNERAFRKIISKEGGSIMNFSQNHLASDSTMAKEKIFVF